MAIDTDTSTALVNAAANGLISRDAVTIFVRDRSDNSIVEFAFWMGDDTVTIAVIDGETGDTVYRDFVGMGGAVLGTPLISVGEIVSVNDLSVQRVPVVFSPLHEAVQSMFRTYDVRLARAEIHRILMDPDAPGVAIGTPECQFIGQVALSPVQTPSAGGEASLSVDFMSDTKELERKNPAKLGNTAMQNRSSGDTMFQYVTEFATGNVQLPWGEAAI